MLWPAQRNHANRGQLDVPPLLDGAPNGKVSDTQQEEDFATMKSDYGVALALETKNAIKSLVVSIVSIVSVSEQGISLSKTLIVKQW